jgi:putative transposase
MIEVILLSDAQMMRISPFFPLSLGIPRVDDWSCRGLVPVL